MNINIDNFTDDQIKDMIYLNYIYQKGESIYIERPGYYDNVLKTHITHEEYVERIKTLIRECNLNRALGDKDEFYWEI